MNIKKNHKNILILVVWMIATVYAVGLSIYNFNLREYWALAQQGKQTIGIVSEKREETHNLIKYEYKVENKTFTWGGYAGDIGKDFAQVTVGEPIKVFYLADNPSFSTMGDPKEIFYTELRGAIILSLIPSFGFWIYKLKALFTNKTVDFN